MKTRYDSKIKMYQTVRALVEMYPPRFFVVPAFQAAYLLFKGYLKKIEDQVTTATAKKKTEAVEAKRRKGVLAVEANKVTRPVLAYANSIKNGELAAIMGIPLSKLKQTMDDRMYAVCQEIHDEAAKVQAEAEAFGLAKDALPNLQTANDSYKETEGVSRLAKGDVTAANKDITRLIPLADWELNKQLDLFVDTISSSDAALASLWKTARKIVGQPTKHTSLTVTVVNEAKALLENALVTVTKETVKTLRTNENGMAHFEPVAFGTVSLKVELDGFAAYKTALLKVVRSEENEVTVVLKTVPPLVVAKG